MKKIIMLLSLVVCMSFSAFANDQVALKDKIENIDDASFQCIKSMTKVRGFYVDNIDSERLDETLLVAQAGKGEYPAGSIIQLVPTEVMIKHPKGTNDKTNDWEFFELKVDKQGSKIHVRGFENVVNKFGGNCLDCHQKAKPEFDMVCEQGHGCDPIPITPAMTAVIQKTDPRCEVNYTLNAEEMAIAKQLKALFGG
ncbi:hypothetical protein [Thalassotalea eurytherma]|uniref:Cytochrome P460 domain-containing protein n=1 Tax=Thalassotalea eurytherma TaxID=1144278 RepID=A0ABQ6H0W6_9GAMM|nr:hypothetical protein [Thalassotalea eurytherma]GLX81747.1 hypothetical protein theurythT_11990 [Thalassotalea eurytherma]